MRKAERGASHVVEILVTVFILMIVAGLVVPALHRTHSRRRAPCLSNLKQIMLGIKTYTPDYGDSYPTHLGPEESGRTSYRDLGILYPNYVSSLEVFTCPQSGDRMPKNRAGGPHDGKPFLPREAKHVGYAYGLNKNAKNKAWTEDAPSDTRVLGDRPATRSLTRRSNHKMDGRNVAYADGHVRWISGTAPLDSHPESLDPSKHGTGREWWSER